MADASDLKSLAERHAGSNPASGTFPLKKEQIRTRSVQVSLSPTNFIKFYNIDSEAYLDSRFSNQ